MAEPIGDEREDRTENPPPPPGFGGTIFFEQAAHVAVLDGRGHIIAVNGAWARFGLENGLAPTYSCIGVSYPAVCERAIGGTIGSEGAHDALGGINAVLAAEQKRFSLIYPCHAPQRQRWFLMYARLIGPNADGAVISHIDVTSFKTAGLVTDETQHQRAGNTPRAGAGDELARRPMPDRAIELAGIDARLR